MDHLIDYAKSFLGVPYKWGGSNPISGADCSGLLQLILAGAGMDPPGDQTAQSLYDHFVKTSTVGVYAAGALAFYGSDFGHIIHVAFMIDQYRIIEAGGGGSGTRTKDDADHQNAFVRMRLVKHRKDFLTTLKPRYSTIGLF